MAPPSPVVNRFVPAAQQAAARYGIPTDLFMRLINQESSWNPGAHSPAGALGLGQLMPDTARGLGVNPLDPAQNLMGAAHYLRDQFNTFHDWRLALAAYNAGPGAVQKYGGVPPYAETQNYVRTIFGNGPGVSAGAPAQAIPAPPGLSAPSLPSARADMSGLLPLLNQTNQMLGLPGLPPGALAGPAPQPMATPAMPQTSAGVATAPAGPKAVAALHTALAQRGVPYKWGGTTPGGFDCSGLVQFSYAQVGISVPRTSEQQWTAGHPVAQNALMPGDAVFFRGAGGAPPGHEAMYVGNGNVIVAPHTGGHVQIVPLSSIGGYMGARRFA